MSIYDARTIVIVGPTHPYTGGIAQHNTRLALELATAGSSVAIESWKSQYPRFLYKGTPRVDRDRPEVGTHDRVVERLAWYSPLSWWRAGRRAGTAGSVLLTVVTPFHAIPYTLLLLAAGRRARRIGLVHNVLPHESSAVDRLLMRHILRSLDTVIVHSESQRLVAIDLGIDAEALRVAELPFPGIAQTGSRPPLPIESSPSTLNLLFFGTIRHYKGLDNLYRALATQPHARLTVAGDFWEPQELYDALAAELGISDRVTVAAGYVDTADIPNLFAAADVLAMPYRSGTASIVSDIAHVYARPIIASNVGTLAESVVDGQTGLVVAPDDVAALAAALHTLSDVAVVRRMSDAVAQQPPKEALEWQTYVHAVVDTE